MFKKNRNALIEEMRAIADRAAQRAVRDHEGKKRAEARVESRKDLEARNLQRTIDTAVASAIADAGHLESSAIHVGVVHDAMDTVQRILDRAETVPNCGAKRRDVVVGGKVGLDVADVVTDVLQVVSNFAHSVSPLRSGLCGGAQSSPTLTVAETGCACQGAASGAGGPSAAPASQTSEGGAV